MLNSQRLFFILNRLNFLQNHPIYINKTVKISDEQGGDAMNRMEINGPGAEFKINMKKLLSSDTEVNRVEASKSYAGTPYFGNYLKNSQPKSASQSLRWMDRYLLSLAGIKEHDTITLRGSLEEVGKTGHSLGNLPIRPGIDAAMLQKQAELIAAGTGLMLKDYIDLATRITNYALRIPFDIQSNCIEVELDYQEQSYIITIRELAFKKQCNEVIKQFLTWWDDHMWQAASPEYLFLKRFCEMKSDRKKVEEQKQAAYAVELEKKEKTEEWEARTLDYVKQVDWDAVNISLGFAMVDPLGAAVELRLENLPENELSRTGILLSKKLHFAELEQSIVVEKQLEYFPEKFKTRVICALAKHMNEVYKAKQPDFYEYKKWHTLCERRDFSIKFSKKFTYYSDDELGIVKESWVSFAEWERNAQPGTYEELFEEE